MGILIPAAIGFLLGGFAGAAWAVIISYAFLILLALVVA